MARFAPLSAVLFSSLLAAQQWTTFSGSPRPPAAHGAAAAWDATRDELVWFGGLASAAAWPPPQALQQTWAFRNGAWSQRTPGVAPPGRTRHAMVFMPNRQIVVLFGGLDAQGSPLNDLWRYDGTNWSTTYHANAPAARADAAMGCAEQWPTTGNDSRVHVFGGWSPVLGDLGDHWSWELQSGWQQHTAPGGPSPRRGAAMATAFSPLPQPIGSGYRLLVHGGRDATTVFADSWILAPDLSPWSWIALPQAAGPARSGHRLVRPEWSGQTFLLGGRDASGAVTGDAWRFDGTRWIDVPVPATVPAVDAPAVAWDAGRERLVRIGGLGSSSTVTDAQWDFVPPARPTYFGAPCVPPGYPHQFQVGQPQRGEVWTGTLSTDHTSGLLYAVFVAGFSDAVWNGVPLPLSLAPVGLPACQLRVEPFWTGLEALPTTWASPAASFAIAVPNVAGLYGLELFAQALAGDATGLRLATHAARAVVW